MPKLFTSLFFLTLFFRLASPASAATYYVSRTGSDTNAGIAAAPFATFNKAVSVLNSGDELLIKGGTYNERLVINKDGTAQAPISVRSAPGEKAITQPTPAEQEAMQKKQTNQQRQRDASNSLAMLIVGLPLYLYHWRMAGKQKEDA